MALQLNTEENDPNDPLSLLDDYGFAFFDGAMPMSLDPGDPLPQPFAPQTVQPSNTAPTGTAHQPRLPEGPTSSSSVAAGRPPQPRDGLGSGSPANAGSLAEFAKRRKWPARVVEELQDLLHVLDANGRIKHVSPNAEHLTGYEPPELRGVFLRDLLHPDDVGIFTSELNESIASGLPLRVFYRLKKKDGTYAVFEAVGHPHIAPPKFAPNPTNQTPFCQAVFVTARPYPTKNAALLDSFLEHKMENERLKRKIAELQREEAQDEPDESQRTWPRARAHDPSAPSRERRTSLYSRQYSETVTAAGHLALGATDAIELLTGLKYQEGERPRGITTGSASPALIKGDAGIAIPVDRDSRAGEKKKKLKVAEEYVCTDCGTSHSCISNLRTANLFFFRDAGVSGMAERTEWPKDAV